MDSTFVNPNVSRSNVQTRAMQCHAIFISCIMSRQRLNFLEMQIDRAWWKTQRRWNAMECRVGCAACCIVISIASPIPGMPEGKPAGVRCVQLTEDNACRLFGKPERPAVCSQFRPSKDMCGDSNEEAFRNLSILEQLSAPNWGGITNPPSGMIVAELLRAAVHLFLVKLHSLSFQLLFPFQF